MPEPPLPINVSNLVAGASSEEAATAKVGFVRREVEGEKGTPTRKGNEKVEVAPILKLQRKLNSKCQSCVYFSFGVFLIG